MRERKEMHGIKRFDLNTCSDHSYVLECHMIEDCELINLFIFKMVTIQDLSKYTRITMIIYLSQYI